MTTPLNLDKELLRSLVDTTLEAVTATVRSLNSMPTYTNLELERFIPYGVSWDVVSGLLTLLSYLLSLIGACGDSTTFDSLTRAYWALHQAVRAQRRYNLVLPQ